VFKVYSNKKKVKKKSSSNKSSYPLKRYRFYSKAIYNIIYIYIYIYKIDIVVNSK